jgi:hypothetical protein
MRAFFISPCFSSCGMVKIFYHLIFHHKGGGDDDTNDLSKEIDDCFARDDPFERGMDRLFDNG